MALSSRQRTQVIAAFTIVLVLWALTPLGVKLFYPDPLPAPSAISAASTAANPTPAPSQSDTSAVMAMRGQFGDLFGTINALFSGLAFAGVLMTLFVQGADMDRDREQAEQNIKYLAQAADAQLKTQHALKQSANAQVYRTAWEILQERTVRDARARVLGELSRETIGDCSDRQLLAAASEVCRSYDAVGKLVRYGLLPLEIAVDSWGVAILKTWQILEPYVQLARERHSSPNYYKGFEELAAAAIQRLAHSPSSALDGA